MFYGQVSLIVVESIVPKMTTVARPKPKSLPKPAVSVAAPVPARDAVLLKAFFTAIDVLDLGVHESAILLAASEKSVRRYRADPASASLHRDQLERIMLVIDIYETLRDIFGGNPLGIEWLRRPNHSFGERRPLDYMLGGSIRDLANVQRYLETQNGGVW